MTNTNETIESKIKHTLIRFGRILFGMLVFVLFVIFMVDVLNKKVVQPYNIKKSITTEFDDYLETVDEFQRLLVETSNSDKTFSLPSSQNSHFYKDYYIFSQASHYKSEVMIYNGDQKMIFTTMPGLEGNSFLKTFNTYFLANMSQTENTYTSVAIDTLSTDVNTMIIGRELMDRHGQKVSVLVYIHPLSLAESIQHNRSAQTVITDKFSQVLATTSQDLVGVIHKYNVDNNGVTLSNKEYKDNNFFNNHEIIEVHTLEENISVLRSYLPYVFIVIILYGGFSVMNRKTAARVGKEITKNLNELMVVVEHIKDGDLDVSISLNSGDELDDLASAINQMAGSLKTLMKSNEQLLTLKNSAEIKQLEAQFNPHFLYNSLENIRYLIVSDPKLAQDLIFDMTKLLRYSIASDQEFVKFKDDLEYIKLYLDVNKIRLGNRFDYNINVSEDVQTAHFPKLLLQPLIENSIKHGYTHQMNLVITLNGYLKDGYYYLEVIDDGAGLDDSALHEVTRILEDKDYESRSYGIQSVVRRVHLLYAPKGSVQLESNHAGTKIIIKIPRSDKDV